jgi:hypothetical protein
MYDTKCVRKQFTKKKRDKFIEEKNDIYLSGFGFVDTNKASKLVDGVLKKSFDDALFKDRLKLENAGIQRTRATSRVGW